jgi:hypothetical protein
MIDKAREMINQIQKEKEEVEPQLVTRKMIEEMMDIENGYIMNEGMYQDLPIFIPYFHSMAYLGEADWEDGERYEFVIRDEDRAMFPELNEAEAKYISICLDINTVGEEGESVSFELA